jgi:hypothetical protein
MRAYLCATCARRCLVVGEEIDPSSQRCICGGELTPVLLSPGQYELIGQGAVPSASESAADKPNEEAPPPDEPSKQSADLGYGASHGYDATHGGPTGPGDAPAK